MKKAAWNHWSQMRTARLWECVALSMNIDPRSTTLDFLKSGPDGYDLDRPFQRERAHFRSRLDIALSHYGHDPLLQPEEGYPERRCSVFRVASFAAWARSFGWQVPKELAELAEAVEPTTEGSDRRGAAPGSNRWPWGGYETELLRRLAEAAEKWWKYYDPGDPTTAPTNAQVERWLRDRGVASRTAEIMASILRADGLPTGPRK